MLVLGVITLSVFVMFLNFYTTWTTLRFSFNKMWTRHHKIEVSVPFSVVHNKVVGVISVGTPKDGEVQTFSVFLNTLTGKTWLPSVDLCENKDCSGKPFKAFDGSRSKTYVRKNTKPFRQKYSEEVEVIGFISEDTIKFESGEKTLAVKKVEFGEVNSMMGKFKGIDGIVGLGLVTNPEYHESLVWTIAQQAKVEPVFGMYIHSIQHDGEDGRLVIGGDGKAFSKGSFNVHTVIKDHKNEYAGWNIEIEKAVVKSKSGRRDELTLSVNTATPVPMLKDISLPEQDVTLILDKIFAEVEFSHRVDSHGSGTFECKSDWKKLPDLTLVIGGVEYILHPEDYVVPLSEEHLGENCVVAISSVGGSKNVRLGQPFMKKYYTRFNFGTKQVEFAEALPIH